MAEQRRIVVGDHVVIRIGRQVLVQGEVLTVARVGYGWAPNRRMVYDLNVRSDMGIVHWDEGRHGGTVEIASMQRVTADHWVRIERVLDEEERERIEWDRDVQEAVTRAEMRPAAVSRAEIAEINRGLAGQTAAVDRQGAGPAVEAAQLDHVLAALAQADPAIAAMTDGQRLAAVGALVAQMRAAAAGKVNHERLGDDARTVVAWLGELLAQVEARCDERARRHGRWA